MTSASSSNHQHPPSTSAPEFPSNQASHTSHIDPNSHMGNSGYAPNDNQLAGLVEAATAAAGQDVSEWAAAAAVAAAAGQQHQLDSYGTDIHIEDDGFGDSGFGTGMGGGRHMRGPGQSSAIDQGQSSGLSRTVSKKRKRGDDPLDPALTGLGGQQSQQHHHHHHQYDGDSLDIRSVPPQSLSEARAIGLHSAAALFRQPSSNKKHTRPPMSKLFASLELSPENFLHLQAAAKHYMLNDEYPERRDCVGQRGKGDTEMVKLRLWNCVRDFLEAEGNGERFFGENVLNEGMGPRTHIWPRDQQKIIALVIPLLRRMVTNERQRQYAIESRKGGGEDRKKTRPDDGFPNPTPPTTSKFTPEDPLQQLHTQQHIPEEYAPPQAQMSAPPQPQIASPSHNVDIGLTDLLLDGYPTDWEAIGKSYDIYNQSYELDNLWSLSGLQQPDWRGLVAAVDSHYQIFHNGAYDCPMPCEDQNVHRILNADISSNLQWRIGGNRDQPARNEFASSITRDVSRVIRDSLASKQGIHTATHDQPPVTQPQFVHQPATTNNTTTTQTQISLRINIIQNGKRILPRVDVPADQFPDLDSMKQHLSRRFAGQLPGLPSDSFDAATGNWNSSVGWKFKVWLPDGLVPVQNDGEWTISLLSATTVDWMDNELKVLVELEGSS